MAARIPKSDQIMPEGRRLEKGIGQRRSKYEGRNPNTARDMANRLGELEKSRERLGVLFQEFIRFLTDKTLPENRSAQDRERQKFVLDNIPKAAADLDMKNVGEGSSVMYSACLNSILIQRDEINKIRFQNHFLNKSLKETKEELAELKAELAGTKEKE